MERRSDACAKFTWRVNWKDGPWHVHEPEIARRRSMVSDAGTFVESWPEPSVKAVKSDLDLDFELSNLESPASRWLEYAALISSNWPAVWRAWRSLSIYHKKYVSDSYPIGRKTTPTQYSSWGALLDTHSFSCSACSSSDSNSISSRTFRDSALVTSKSSPSSSRREWSNQPFVRGDNESWYVWLTVAISSDHWSSSLFNLQKGQSGLEMMMMGRQYSLSQLQL